MNTEERVHMATLFYPGCQIKKDYPEASKKLAEYIQSKRPVEVVGCCRVDHGKSTQEDTALVVCNNCANIIAESGDPRQHRVCLGDHRQ